MIIITICHSFARVYIRNVKAINIISAICIREYIFSYLASFIINRSTFNWVNAALNALLRRLAIWETCYFLIYVMEDNNTWRISASNLHSFIDKSWSKFGNVIIINIICLYLINYDNVNEKKR